jgi:outer membrane protein assembly factor BamB
VNLKSKWRASRVAFLLALIIAVGLVGFGCVSGLAPVGWSGGTITDGTLYVGSREGRLVSINLSDESRLLSEPLIAVSKPGLFGCSPSMGGGGCGGASSGVPVYGTPVVFGELAYMAGYNGKIYAYTASNLGVRWVYPREGNLKPLVGGLVESQGKLFIGGSDGKVYALDAASGDKLWEFTTGDKIWGTPAVNGDTLYIGSFDKKLYALNTIDGTKKWEYATEGSVISTPLVYQDTVFFGSFDRNLYALKASDGSLKWKFSGKNFFWAEPVVVNDTIYVGCLDGFIYVLQAATGVKVAEIDLKNPVSSKPVIVANSIIFANRKGVVYSLATGTNEIKQLADIKNTVDGPLTAYGEIVYIHTQDMMLQRINAVSGASLTPISLHT